MCGAGRVEDVTGPRSGRADRHTGRSFLVLLHQFHSQRVQGALRDHVSSALALGWHFAPCHPMFQRPALDLEHLRSFGGRQVRFCEQVRGAWGLHDVFQG